MLLLLLLLLTGEEVGGVRVGVELGMRNGVGAGRGGGEVLVAGVLVDRRRVNV